MKGLVRRRENFKKEGDKDRAAADGRRNGRGGVGGEGEGGKERTRDWRRGVVGTLAELVLREIRVHCSLIPSITSLPVF